MQAKNLKVICLHLLLLALYSAVFLSVDIPALTDYPNHLARMFVMTHSDEHPKLQEYYYVKHEIAPYLGMDVFFRIFSFINIYLLGKIFIITSFALISAGVLTVNYAIFKQLRYETLLFFPFLLGTNLLHGYINYYFSIGFALIGFGVWLMLPDKRKLLFLLPYSILLFFIHIFGYAALMLMTGLYLLCGKQLNIKNICSLAACCVVPLFIILFVTPLHDISMQKKTFFLGLADLQTTFTSPVFFYNDLICIPLLILFWLMLISRTINLQKMLWPVVALFVISFFVPHTTFGISYTNIRLPVFAYLLAAASCKFTEKRRKYPALIIYVVLAAAHLLTVYGVLLTYDAPITKYRAALKNIPAHSKLLTVKSNEFITPLNHIGSLAIIDGQHFVPELFTGIPPIKVKPEYSAISIPVGEPQYMGMLSSTPENRASLAEMFRRKGLSEQFLYWLNWRKDFDYVIMLYPTSFKLPEELELVTKDKYFEIYKVRKQ